jgi:hypothetical protein
MGLLGAGSFGTGVAAVFVTENGTGTGVLLGVGGAFLVLAVLGDRMESFELGGAKVGLRAVVEDTYALAAESERQGDAATARRLRAQAQDLLDAVGSVTRQYRSVRDSMAPGAQRTTAMEAVFAQGRRLAEQQRFEPAAVLRWLREGADDERVTALAMMQARRELRDFEAVLTTIEHSHSAFEQYHAMRLASNMVDDLDAPQRIRLAEIITAQRRSRTRFDERSDRWPLSEDILRKANAHTDDRESSNEPAG